MERHFAFFRQDTGTYVREWKGPVAAYRRRWWHLNRQAALNRWATRVSRPKRGEIGLDVTHIGWPVGDFCYCTFDVTDRMLEWGPPRHYIEVDVATGQIVANQESHRPGRSAVPGQRLIDITGTVLEPYHGRLFGRFVQRDGRWALQPSIHTPLALEAAAVDAALDLFAVSEPVGVLRCP